MTRVTDFGKAFMIAGSTRRSHPDETTVGLYRMDQVSNTDNYWMLLLRTVYFTTGGNPNSGHRTLAQMEGSAATSVIGYGSHVSGAGAWYTGNSIPVGNIWATPTIEVGSSFVTLPSRTLLFAAATYPVSNIEGVALCLRNAAAAATECVQIYRFTNGALTATSAGQTLSLSNGRATLSDT